MLVAPRCALRSSFKILGVVPAFIFVSSCSTENVEWIDVPLSQNTYFDAQPLYREDVVEIPLSANSDLEYMLDMGKGHSVVYQWEAIDLPDADTLLAEFHGHTIRTTDAPGDVMFYKQGRSDASSGYLVAPFDGVHGWYFSNETDTDTKVLLSLSGFYEIPKEP